MKKTIPFVLCAAALFIGSGCKTVIKDVSSADTQKTRLMTADLTFADIENAVGTIVYGGNDAGGVPAGKGMLEVAAIKEITAAGKKPVLVLDKVTDTSGSLGLNTGDIRNSIMEKLTETGKFVVMDKAARGELAKEIKDQQTEGLTRNEEQKQFGSFRGASFYLNGSILSESHSLNDETVMVYKLKFTLNSLDDGSVVWIKSVIAKQTVVNR